MGKRGAIPQFTDVSYPNQGCKFYGISVIDGLKFYAESFLKKHENRLNFLKLVRKEG